MKTINIELAYKILGDASAVIINDSTLVYPSLYELEGSDENEFLYFKWDDEGLEYSLTFNEGDNQEVIISGSSLFLYDTDANDETDYTQITLLSPTQLE